MAAGSDDDDKGGAERRIQERVSGRVEVRFGEQSQAARALRAYSLNFSVGGLCVRTKKPYELGEEVSLGLTVAGIQLELQAAVAWIRGDAVGFRFLSLTEVERQLLAGVVDSIKQAAPS